MLFILIRRCLPMVMLFCFASLARAESNGAESLEWLSCSAEGVVKGKIISLKAVPGPYSVIYEDCVLEIEETLKGDFGKQVEFTWREHEGRQTLLPMLKAKQGVLLFLIRSKDQGSDEKRLDGKWVPISLVGLPMVIDLSSPTHVYSKEMKILTDGGEILNIARVWSKSPIKQSLWRQVPFNTPVWEKLFSGSACFLIVPAEEKYRDEFMKQAKSNNAYDRVKAAEELAKYPGKETEEMLRELLKDNSESFSHYANDEIAQVKFWVKAAAYESLKSLGQSLPPMDLERKPTEQEKRDLREKAWKESFSQALKEGWTIAVTDGPARQIENRERVIVNVECKRENEQATFTLVPKNWPAGADVVGKEYFGIYGYQSQNERLFYLQGNLSEESQKTLTQYFGMKK